MFNKSWSPSPIFFTEKHLVIFNQFLTLKNDFENQIYEMSKEVVQNFCKSDGDIIFEKMLIVGLRVLTHLVSTTLWLFQIAYEGDF